jgi:hypothetical protein
MGLDLTGLGSVFDFGTKVLERIFPDPAERLKAQTTLEQLRSSGELAKLAAETDLIKGQLAINAEEAKSTNWFVAGWRPAVGWIGAFSLGYAAILEPLIRFTAKVVFHYDGAFPVLDSNITMQILFGILGLGAYRTVEKVKKGG